MSINGNLAATVTVKVQSSLASQLELSAPVDNPVISLLQKLANGTGSGNAQIHYFDQRTLADASESLDLNGGVVGPFGVCVFTKIKMILIQVVTATAGAYLLVGGASADACATFFGSATDRLKVGAGGFALLCAPVDGYVVTPSTGDILEINNPAIGTVEYNIAVIGEGTQG